MKVGIPSETKADEYRVSMTPAGVRELTDRGHEVLVQAGAGAASGFPDAHYAAQGATIAPDADAVFAGAEHDRQGQGAAARPRSRGCATGQILFTYLHLAPAPELTRALCDSGATCDRLRDGRGPPGPPAAARADVGDRGPARDAGGRVHAREAARRPRRAARRRARRRRGERDGDRRRQRRRATPPRSRSAWAPTSSSSTSRSTACASSRPSFGGRCSTVHSSTLAIEELLPRTDLVIGAVLRRRRPRAVRDPPQPARR